MYIIKNAFRCIARAKGRNILIGIVVLLLSVSSCIGLSIKQANRSLKQEYAESIEISATVNPKDMRQNGSISLETLTELADNSAVKDFYYSTSLYFAAGDDIEPLDVAGSFRKNKDFRAEHGDIKSGDSTSSTSSYVESTAYTARNSAIVTLAEEYSIPTESSDDTSQNDSSQSTSSEEGTTSSESTDSQEEKPQQKPDEDKKTPDGNESDSKTNPFTPPSGSDSDGQSNMPTPPSGSSDNSFSGKQSSDMPNMPGGDTFITNNFFFNMASMNDFTVVGYSKAAAVPEYVASLNVLDNDSDELNCVISTNLAEENELEVGSKFTLKNPDNEDETYEFCVVGICDPSQSTDTQDTASNASFTDNYIHISSAAIEKIIANSATVNATEETEEGTEETTEEDTSETNGKKDTEEKDKALTGTHSGTFIFANLADYNKFSESVSEEYSLVSEDVSNYEQSISQLETLGKYATYFLIVIFVIGAFVLVIINLFSIRNRKYEVGVLTAIGMKKYKVALQFIIELFVVTFIALIIGSAVGAATSVPVTNSLLTTVNAEEKSEDTTVKGTDTKSSDSFTPSNTPSGFGNGKEQFSGKMPEQFTGKVNNYITQVKSATDITVILQMVLVGLGLTLVSSAASIAFVMRYEPLKILNNRD